ncbi:TetR family transcriptional regulator, partial [Streptomyces vinaceus]|uniref:TetR family transcriptional regulator n=1 Tax=Streptomyces vinaceus TaxID=1960 RepID=UPI00367F0B96
MGARELALQHLGGVGGPGVRVLPAAAAHPVGDATAREAEVSPGTLYQFFPNKEAIAIHLGDELLR